MPTGYFFYSKIEKYTNLANGIFPADAGQHYTVIMAINSISDSTKEHDMYQRRLRELSDKYSNDVDKIKSHYDRNIDEIDEQNKATIGELRNDSENKVKAQRVNQERELTRMADRFERQSQLDSKKYYDKYGKALDANSREVQHIKKGRDEQVAAMVKGHNQSVDNLKKGQEEELFNVRRQSNTERFRTDDETQKKLDKMGEVFAKQNRQTTKDFNETLDAERRRTFEEMRNLKMTSDLRLEQQENQSKNAIKNQQNAFGSREKQLQDERQIEEKKIEASGGEALRTYRERLSDNLSKVQADHNFENARKDIKQANDIARLQHENKLQNQDQKNSIARAALERESSLVADRDRLKLNGDLNNRRLIHDQYLGQETQKKRYEDTIAELNNEHSAALQNVQMRQQENFDDMKQGFAKKLNSLEDRSRNEYMERNIKDQDNKREGTSQHLSERNRIVNAYEQKQRTLERNASKQSQAQNEYYKNERIRDHRLKEESISKSNQENMDKMYQQRVRLESINEIQNKDHSNKVTSLQDSQQRALSGMSNKHAMTIQEIQEIYGTQFDELRRDSANEMAKLRADNDSAMKTMSFDYDYRIRDMAQKYESRISDLLLQHEREMNAVKKDHERLTRQNQQHHKSEIQTMMDNNKKALVLVETQYKDKMKVQEDNHKTDLARMQHSNEILRSKS